MSGFNYYISYGGGEGPDVWDKSEMISAADIFDAVSQAKGRAEEAGGWLTSVEQCDYPTNEQKTILRLTKELKEAKSTLLPEDCVLVAHYTGDGWALSVENQEGDMIAYLKWPDEWPEIMNSDQIAEAGFRID